MALSPAALRRARTRKGRHAGCLAHLSTGAWMHPHCSVFMATLPESALPRASGPSPQIAARRGSHTRRAGSGHRLRRYRKACARLHPASGHRPPAKSRAETGRSWATLAPSSRPPVTLRHVLGEMRDQKPQSGFASWKPATRRRRRGAPGSAPRDPRSAPL